jgi:trehalose 6-phosphate phosphatase
MNEHLDLRADPRGMLVVLDFDGSLAPITARPGHARLLDGMAVALMRLTALGARVAVISGREAETVLELSGLIGLPGLIVAGLYGAEHWYDGELMTQPEPIEMTQVRQALPGIVATADGLRLDGLRIEDKRLSLVVHARGAADPQAALAAIRADVIALAVRHGLQAHDGRDVLEIRLPGYDKGVELRRLAAEFAPAQVLYAGDDLGDVPAFEAIAELRTDARPAWAVAVSSAEVPDLTQYADLAVDGPPGLLALLGELADRAGPV